MAVEIDKEKLNEYCSFLAYYKDDLVHTGLTLRELELKLEYSEKILFNKGKYFDIIPIVEVLACWDESGEWCFDSTKSLIDNHYCYDWAVYDYRGSFEDYSKMYKNKFNEWKKQEDEIKSEKEYVTVNIGGVEYECKKV